MKLYHVQVDQEDEWFIGRVLERDGITTQGRSLDELVYMVRDAILLMWQEADVQLELIVPGKTRTAFERKRRLSRTSKRGGQRRTRSSARHVVS
jgi:predicted RNase H-like HicB family nuclease